MLGISADLGICDALVMCRMAEYPQGRMQGTWQASAMHYVLKHTSIDGFDGRELERQIDCLLIVLVGIIRPTQADRLFASAIHVYCGGQID